MKTSTKIILIVICLVFIIFLVGILVWGIVLGDSFYERDLKTVKEEQFSIEAIKEISVNAKSADIQIFRTNTDQIRIVEKATKKRKEYFRATTSNGTLKIEGQRGSNFCIGFCFFREVVYEIYIPESYEEKLTIKTASGDIFIDSDEDHYSSALLTSISGDIKLRGKMIADDIKLKTTSGDIKTLYLNGSSIDINTVSGDVQGDTIESDKIYIKTTSGDVELGWLKGEVGITSVSGDIELDYLNITGSSELKTTSGDIEILLDKNASVKMHGDSVSGEIRFPHSESVLGEGEHSLSFKTVSGDIKVRVADK